jgi:hypothetical protein
MLLEAEAAGMVIRGGALRGWVYDENNAKRDLRLQIYPESVRAEKVDVSRGRMR